MVSYTSQGTEELGCHIFTTNELSFAHGFPTTTSALPQYHECDVFDLAALSIGTQSTAMGKGMHIALQGAWYMHVFSKLIRQDSLQHAVPILEHCAMRCEDSDY